MFERLAFGEGEFDGGEGPGVFAGVAGLGYEDGEFAALDELFEARRRAAVEAELGVLGSLKLAGRTVLLVSCDDKNLTLGSRNVPHVTLTSGEKLNTYETLLCDKLVFTKAAFAKVAARLADQ